MAGTENNYTEENIKTLEWNEHIRKRAGMYIGRLGNGDNPGDGIYVLLKEVIDNSIDEFAMGYGKVININIGDTGVSVRDFGRGIPLNSVVDVTSKLNTGGKFDDSAFKKAVGLNGVGTKAVNALSSSFYIESFRDGESSFARFSKGELLESGRRETKEKNGTLVRFTPDEEMFGHYSYKEDIVVPMIKNYSYLKKGLTLNFKVYQRDEVNAFACGDGSVRIYSGLMDVMTNDELVAIIGHEIGHVARNDAKNALKNAYLKSAAESAAGSVSKGVAAQLSQSQLMELTHALASAQYSQQQEYAADEYGFEFCVRQGIDPYAMYNALTKLSQLSTKPGAHTSTLLQAFSTHPDSGKRAEKMKAKADELQH